MRSTGLRRDERARGGGVALQGIDADAGHAATGLAKPGGHVFERGGNVGVCCQLGGKRVDHANAEFTQSPGRPVPREGRSEEHTSELQSLMRLSYAVFCLKQKKIT